MHTCVEKTFSGLDFDLWLTSVFTLTYSSEDLNVAQKKQADGSTANSFVLK